MNEEIRQYYKYLQISDQSRSSFLPHQTNPDWQDSKQQSIFPVLNNLSLLIANNTSPRPPPSVSSMAGGDGKKSTPLAFIRNNYELNSPASSSSLARAEARISATPTPVIPTPNNAASAPLNAGATDGSDDSQDTDSDALSDISSSGFSDISDSDFVTSNPSANALPRQSHRSLDDIASYPAARPLPGYRSLNSVASRPITPSSGAVGSSSASALPPANPRIPQILVRQQAQRQQQALAPTASQSSSSSSSSARSFQGPAASPSQLLNPDGSVPGSQVNSPSVTCQLCQVVQNSGFNLKWSRWLGWRLCYPCFGRYGKKRQSLAVFDANNPQDVLVTARGDGVKSGKYYAKPYPCPEGSYAPAQAQPPAPAPVQAVDDAPGMHSAWVPMVAAASAWNMPPPPVPELARPAWAASRGPTPPPAPRPASPPPPVDPRLYADYAVQDLFQPAEPAALPTPSPITPAARVFPRLPRPPPLGYDRHVRGRTTLSQADVQEARDHYAANPEFNAPRANLASDNADEFNARCTSLGYSVQLTAQEQEEARVRETILAETQISEMMDCIQIENGTQEMDVGDPMDVDEEEIDIWSADA
ncbi:hypothetical protein G7046_g4713 [Stylonectria norvegica]|nr:hypothetical protein G7046_g4713 [Stylonectria norvegica]